MKKLLLAAFFLLFGLTSAMPQKNVEGIKDLKLWYNYPASVWEEALPLGNGRIGAMVFGNPLNELYQLNEETLWSGTPQAGENPRGAETLSVIRQVINDGDYKKASELWKSNSQGPYTSKYLPMADLKLDMLSVGEVENVYRDLNISNASATVEFQQNGIKYKRTSFMSYPDQVMVVRLEADQKQSINVSVSISSQLRYVTNVEENNSCLILKGKAPKYVATRNYESEQIIYADEESGEGMNFVVCVKVLTEGGQLTTNEGTLTLREANVVTLIVSGATSFNGFNKSPGLEGKNPSVDALRHLNNAQKKTYTQLWVSHVNDYKKLFDRVKLDLGGQMKNAVPTNERLDLFSKDDSDNGLVALYYQFGRYMTIASSRQGGMPSNLQGIWNRHIQPPWNSNYTVNINTEMNYWLTETTNLPECTQPLLDFLPSLAFNGQKTAKVNYGIDKGWVAHHNSDVWALSYPVGGYDSDKIDIAHVTCWPMAGAWLSQHLWEHYAFSGDKIFLKNKAYPIMKEAAEFMLEWLILDNESRYLVTNPSTSPENKFEYLDKIDGKLKISGFSKASTMDMAIIWDLFTNCIEASLVLAIDSDFRKTLEQTKEKLYPPHIGSEGQLLEWFKEFKEVEPKHRHVSHLFGLHPGRQISPRLTPDLAAAAKRTLELRGDGGTGWAMAWKINFWARLEDGNHAYLMLKNGLRHVKASEKASGGGTYSNLFDAHPPFQIDGNFGGTAGITEMLLQSHGDEIFLLPALPDNWAKGSIKGLRARGGFVVDMEWEDSKPVKVVVHSTLGGNCRIRYCADLQSKDIKVVSATGNNTNPFYAKIKPTKFEMAENAKTPDIPVLKETNLIDFKTIKGKIYTLK